MIYLMSFLLQVLKKMHHFKNKTMRKYFLFIHDMIMAKMKISKKAKEFYDENYKHFKELIQ